VVVGEKAATLGNLKGITGSKGIGFILSRDGGEGVYPPAGSLHATLSVFCLQGDLHGMRAR
jgi:hypothetical protein